MKYIIKYNNKKFVSEEIDKKRIKTMDIQRFYERWYEQIVFCHTVGDFTIHYKEKSVSVKWLELTINGGVIHDDEFLLDESVINNPYVLMIFKELEESYYGVKREALRDFLPVAKKLERRLKMDNRFKEAISAFMKTSKIEAQDKKELFELVDWINRNGYESSNVFVKGLEKFSLAVLASGGLFCIYEIFQNFVLYYLSKGTKDGALETMSFSLVGLLIIGVVAFDYIKACNGSAVTGFLDEFYEKYGQEFQAFENAGASNEKMNSTLKDLLENLISTLEAKDESVPEDLGEHRRELDSRVAFNLKERFEHMRTIIGYEIEIYADGSLGLKDYIEGSLSSEDFVRRLSYVGYDKSKVHIEYLFGVLADIESSPYHGCERDILDIYELGIEAVYLQTKYSQELYEYTDDYIKFLVRKRETVERIEAHRKAAKKYTILKSALDNTVTMREDGSVHVEPEKSIKFQQV